MHEAHQEAFLLTSCNRSQVYVNSSKKRYSSKVKFYFFLKLVVFNIKKVSYFKINTVLNLDNSNFEFLNYWFYIKFEINMEHWIQRLGNIYEKKCFGCEKETPPCDVYFAHPNYMFDRTKTDNINFGSYLPIIRTTDNSKENLYRRGLRIYEI